MNYYIEPTAFSAVFTIPCAVADKHLLLAGEAQLKVLLYLLRNLSTGIDPVKISDALALPKSDVDDALLYWTQAQLLKTDAEPAVTPEPVAEKAVRRAVKPTRTDVAQRGYEDEKIRFLLREAQMKFGRNLKSTEASALVWLYDDEGMDVSVILMLIQYAVTVGRCNISFIEKTAVDWINKGVQNVSDAERRIADAVSRNAAWGVVENAFGIEKRMPSTRELELSGQWVNEWGMSPELLRCAYDACIDAKAKLSVPYVAKILEAWHKKGYQTPDDVKKSEQQRQAASDKKSGSATYDLDAFEKMLNSDD